MAAPPGTGKTTRVPGALLDAADGEVWVLEPRRIAARAAARRVAEERGGDVGDEVGYQVRHDRAVSRSTRLRFLTEGVMMRRITSDPFLESVSAVVLDEFHERHLEGDIVLAMLREVRQTVRPDLRIVVMSATLDVDRVAAFLGGSEVVSVASTMHPVAVVHADRRDDRPLERQIAAAVARALEETDGDVLVFLPGVGEIRAAETALAGRAGVETMALHGRLSAAEQDRALRRGAGRRVVLATNLAETSLTIPGITAVVDSGMARVLRHDPHTGLDALRLERISKASAEQRRGRAGRLAPGVCYGSGRGEERGLLSHDTPEVRRVDVAGAVLAVRAFAGRPAAEFGWFEAPPRTPWPPRTSCCAAWGHGAPRRRGLGARCQDAGAAAAPAAGAGDARSAPHRLRVRGGRAGGAVVRGGSWCGAMATTPPRRTTGSTGCVGPRTRGSPAEPAARSASTPPPRAPSAAPVISCAVAPGRPAIPTPPKRRRCERCCRASPTA